jgi:hypothetical protein
MKATPVSLYSIDCVTSEMKTDTSEDIINS